MYLMLDEILFWLNGQGFTILFKIGSILLFKREASGLRRDFLHALGKERLGLGMAIVEASNEEQ
jgi:hypothetical protein